MTPAGDEVGGRLGADLLSVLFGGTAERDACVMVAERGGHDGVDGCPESLGETGYALARAGVPPGRDPSSVCGYAGHTTKTT